MNSAHWLNTLWKLKCRRAAMRFGQAAQNVEAAQWNVLRKILRNNQQSDFGVRHQFSDIRGPQEYLQQVPLSTYDDYRNSIDRICAGDLGVLTTEPVRLLEPTSGSSGGEKLIPYTASLSREFQQAIDVWIYRLMTHQPAVRSGRAYWSISPCMRDTRVTAGGIPIGFDDDVAYLSRWEQWAVRRLMVAPHWLTSLTDMENFRYATLLHLLYAADLSLISVWSPTYLITLLDSVHKYFEPIIKDLRRGTISWPKATGTSTDVTPTRRLAWQRGGERRAEELTHWWRSFPNTADFYAHIWPQLHVISCWTDGPAAQYLPHLRERFPTTHIQAKGLLSTEACVSIPLCDCLGNVLAIRSHFFEFEPYDASGTPTGESIQLAHRVVPGRIYRVIVTTGGGLYRYRTGDLVEVIGKHDDCPVIQFLGRADHVTDLVGEKLSEPHVRAVLDRAIADCKLKTSFAMLTPEIGRSPGYTLSVQLESGPVEDRLEEKLGEQVEKGLRENPYYDHAIRMRQLRSLQVSVFDSSRRSLWRMYEQSQISRGKKMGDIKPTALASIDWRDDYDGD